MKKFVSAVLMLDIMAAAIGVVFYFLNVHFVTVLCAGITLFNSVIQVKVGNQKNFYTEALTIFVGLIIALIFKLEMIPCFSLCLCIAEIFFFVTGYIRLAVQVMKFRKHIKKYK